MYFVKSVFVVLRRPARAVFLGCGTFVLMAFTGCPPDPPVGGDTTPPEFFQGGVIVQVSHRGVDPIPPERGQVDITTKDVTLDNLAEDIVIRVKASAGDSGSGIKEIKVDGKVNWRCGAGTPGSEIYGIFQEKPIVFTPHVLPSSSTQVWQINETADPIAMIEAECGPDGYRPIKIAGTVLVTATNGINLTTYSRVFAFEYTDIGVQ